MKVALLANSASSLWPFTDCRASWSTGHGSTCVVMLAASAEVGYGRVNCAPPVDESTGGAQWIKNVDFFFFEPSLWISSPSVRCYVGTAVSRLRRPCLSLRLLLYSAISSRAEVPGGAVCISASGLAARPGEKKHSKLEQDNFTVVIILVRSNSWLKRMEPHSPTSSIRSKINNQHAKN